jgi:hypothetical protein
MRASKKLKAISVYLKSDNGSSEKDSGYKQHKPYFICNLVLSLEQ